MEGKWFADNYEGAVQHARCRYPMGNSRIVAAEIPADLLPLLFRQENLDGFFDCEERESPELRIEAMRQVAAIVERALSVWNGQPASEGLSYVTCAGLLSGAISFKLLGENARCDELSDLAETVWPSSIRPVPRASRRRSNDIITLLETKHQIDAQLLTVN